MKVQAETKARQFQSRCHKDVAQRHDLKIGISPDLKLVIVQGWSVNERLHRKYSLLLDFVDAHMETHNSLRIYFRYELFNCSTCKYLFILIKKFNRFHQAGKKVAFHWNCSGGGTEMLETGMDLMDMCDFEFKLRWDQARSNFCTFTSRGQ